MENFPIIFLAILFILTFFGISISCVVIWIKSFKQTSQILKDPNKHWSFKAAIYYGMSFTVFVIAAMLLGVILAIALVLSEGIHV